MEQDKNMTFYEALDIANLYIFEYEVMFAVSSGKNIYFN